MIHINKKQILNSTIKNIKKLETFGKGSNVRKADNGANSVMAIETSSICRFLLLFP